MFANLDYLPVRVLKQYRQLGHGNSVSQVIVKASRMVPRFGDMLHLRLSSLVVVAGGDVLSV